MGLLLNKTVHHLMGGFFILLLLSACAATPQSDKLISAIPPALKNPHELREVPFNSQEDYQCGPAALATMLQTQGYDIQPEDLVSQVYIPARKGSLQIEMISTTRRYGLIPYILRPELEEVLNEIRAGRPVLVFQNLGLSIFPQWHYAVLIGYDLNNEELILRSGREQRYVMSMYTFERTWQRTRHWSMITLKPGEMPVSPDEWRYVKAIVGFEHLKNWDALEKAYNAGLDEWPFSQELNIGLGNLYYFHQQPDKARERYEFLIKHHPDYAPAHNNLAQVLAEQGELDKALAHAQRAVELGGPHVDQYMTTLNQIIDQRKQKK